MASKTESRVVLFLVEGQNDEYALIPPFKRLIAGEARTFSQAFHCDVTVAHIFRDRNKLTLGRDVCDTVRRFILDRLAKRPGYQWGDIAKVVHIVDTDGAFVPPDAVIEDESALGIEYGLDCIRCHDRNRVVRRNSAKSESLDMLVGKRVLRYKGHPVPYSVFYLSRNFEHALFGIGRELSNDEKNKLAQNFRREYAENADGFVELLDRAADGVPDDYRESWEYIKEGCRSLEGHSNLRTAMLELISDGIIPQRRRAD